MAVGRGGPRAGSGRKPLGLDTHDERVLLLSRAITTRDRLNILRKLKDKALAGDLKAIEMCLHYLYGKPENINNTRSESDSHIRVEVVYKEPEREEEPDIRLEWSEAAPSPACDSDNSNPAEAPPLPEPCAEDAET